VKRYRFRCYACDRSLKKVEAAPMLHNEIWQRIADPGEYLLCEQCARQRAKYRLGRDLTVADLIPCAFNLSRSPPWNAVLPLGNITPEISAEWDIVIRGAQASVN
jgi:hypothetical protein